MAFEYDMILAGGYVVDPVNGLSGIRHIGVTNGKIAAVDIELDPARAKEVIDVTGKHVLPGIIDLHVHASKWLGGKFAHKMMALAGVTTALDMSGPVEGVLDIARDWGAGLSIACLEFVRPGFTVKDSNPSRGELRALMQDVFQKGGIGCKVLGGHYPLTPDATAAAIEVADESGGYVGFHAGTTESDSDIEGFHEALALAGGRPLHLAHINSYCRGLKKDVLTETQEAIKGLVNHPNVCSESYLGSINAASGKCSGGIPESKLTRKWLEIGGFEATEKGMEEAVMAGWALINMEKGGQVVLASGENGLQWWKSRITNTAVSFNVNPPAPRLLLSIAKRDSGAFAVDCLGTDGGGIPRNVTVERGLSLVKLQALTIEEFVMKTGKNPAAILGLDSKGHLGVGADADISVVSLENQKPFMSLSNGEVIMYGGHVCRQGSRIITTPQGAAAVGARGLPSLVLDPDARPFLKTGTFR